MRYAVSISSMMFLSLLGGVAQARGPAGGSRGERPVADRPAPERPANERALVKPEWLRARAERAGAPSTPRAERAPMAREFTKESASEGSFAAPRAAGAFTRVARVVVADPGSRNQPGAHIIQSGGSQSGGSQSGGSQSGGSQSGGSQPGGGSHQGGSSHHGAGQGGDHLKEVIRSKQRCPANDVLCGAQKGEIAEPGAPDAKNSGKTTLDLAKEAPADGGLLKLAAPLHRVAETFRSEAVRKLLCNRSDGGFCSR
jgi:hypothetical protein